MQRPLLFKRVREGAVEVAQRFFGMRSEQTRGKASERCVGLLEFGWCDGQRCVMPRDGGEVAARNGAGPRFFCTEAFEIRESLANERQKSHFGAATREADFHQDTHGAFDDDEKKGGGEGAGCVIGSFDISAQSDRNASDGTCDAASDALRTGIALYGEDDAIERRGGAVTESLERMDRASEGAAARERGEDGRIERAAGVENDFAAPLVSAETREVCSDVAYRVVGSSDQDNAGMQDARGNPSEGVTGSDGANGGARGSFRARNDGGNFPIGTMQAAAQDASEAASAYNRDGGGHCA